MRAKTAAREMSSDTSGRLSPDTRWVAYQSNESGRAEIYVQPFPGTGGKVQVSTSGGLLPRWRGDGKELFYIDLDNRMIAVPMVSNPGSIRVGGPVPLFAMPPIPGGLGFGG